LPHRLSLSLTRALQAEDDKADAGSDDDEGEEAVQLVYDEGAGSTLAATLLMAQRKGFLETPKTAAAAAASAAEAAGAAPPTDRSRSVSI
jgi:hypothetical protein